MFCETYFGQEGEVVVLSSGNLVAHELLVCLAIYYYLANG